MVQISLIKNKTVHQLFTLTLEPIHIDLKKKNPLKDTRGVSYSGGNSNSCNIL